MKLVEVIRGRKTSDETTNTIIELSETIKKIAIEVNDYPGFIANRILLPMINEAIEALNEDEFAREVLGKSMLHQFFSYKMDEWDRYHQSVTDWEVQEFLRLY